VLLSITDNPAQTAAVTWRSERAPSPALAQIARAGVNRDFQKSATNIDASTTRLTIHGREITSHAARFTGLQPATRYCYRVGAEGAWSEWHEFRTASEHAAAFRFIYLGDEQNEIRSLWSRSARNAYAHAYGADFIVHAGDLLQEGYDDALWGEWCDAMGFVGASLPNLPVPGNHDLHRDPLLPQAQNVLSVSPLWRSHFALPQNGPAGVDELKGQSYFLDYQGARFVALDVNVFANEAFDASAKTRIAQAQLAWLDKTLADNPHPWTIVVQHQPIYPVAKGRDYEQMRAALQPIYERRRVDIVLQGHDHIYSRTHRVAQNQPVAQGQAGVVYAISVSGPKMYEVTDRFPQLRAKTLTNTQAHQIIDVAPDKLRYSAYTIDGEVIDSFQLTRNSAGEKTYMSSPTDEPPCAKKPALR